MKVGFFISVLGYVISFLTTTSSAFFIEFVARIRPHLKTYKLAVTGGFRSLTAMASAIREGLRPSRARTAAHSRASLEHGNFGGQDLESQGELGSGAASPDSGVRFPDR